jgi:hypothetical protein
MPPLQSQSIDSENKVKLKRVEQSHKNRHFCGTAHPYENMTQKNSSLNLKENTQNSYKYNKNTTTTSHTIHLL